MPRASPSAKRQPGASNRDAHAARYESNGLINSGRRSGRHQPRVAASSGLPGGGLSATVSGAVSSPPSLALASPVAPVTLAASSSASSVSSPQHRLAAAAAAAAAANVCTRDFDVMTSGTARHRSSLDRHDRHTHRSNPDAMALASAASAALLSASASPSAPNSTPALASTSSSGSGSGSGLTSSATSSPALMPAASLSSPPFSSFSSAVAASPALVFDDAHRRIDVNASKNANVHRDTGPIDLALTVLRSCPLYDTIAILIILMQLSPIFLSTIYMLFTVLTFVPPVTTSSGLSITDIFDGSLTTPSLTNMLVMDVFFLLVWLFLWGPVQQVILDCAQVVIALTLGGGGSSGSPRQRSTNNIFVCVGIVLLSHFGHVPSLQRIPHLGPLLASEQGISVTSGRGGAVFQPRALFGRRAGGGASWVRNMFAIHILMQGIVRYVREWYIRRERRDTIAHALSDPEAVKGSAIGTEDMWADPSVSVADADTVSGLNNSSNNGGGGHGFSQALADNNSGNNNSGISSNNNNGTNNAFTMGNSANTNSLTTTGNSHSSTSGGAIGNASASSDGNASSVLDTSFGADTAAGALHSPLFSASTAGATTASSATAVGSLPGSLSPLPGPLSSKKKRKQNALVRLRQPLWAALASTKIVMIKEYELSQAASESAGAEATDVDNLGNAPFYAQPRQIWICYIGHDEVCFSTSEFDNDNDNGNGIGNINGNSNSNSYKDNSNGLPTAVTATHSNHTPNSSYIDTGKPFYVRINSAIWQATRIMPVTNDAGNDYADDTDVTGASITSDSRPSVAVPAGRRTRWTGDIYGLTPLASYECEFVSTRTGEVLFSTSVRTAPAPSRSASVATTAAAAAATSKPVSTPQLRPHVSPATTIKASIATQEAKLNDEKTRLKTLRKDHNRRINTLKREIDRLSASVQSAGGNDEKLKQKIHQNNVQQKHAEDDIEKLNTELGNVSAVPEDLLSQQRIKKTEWDREKAQFDGAVASFNSFKSAVDSEIRVLEEDRASLLAKHTKIASRIAKADSDYARIMDANARGLDEAERRQQDRAAIENEHQRNMQKYAERIAALQAANSAKVNAIKGMHETLRTFYSSFDSERPYEDRYASVAAATAAITAGSPPPSAPSVLPPSQLQSQPPSQIQSQLQSQPAGSAMTHASASATSMWPTHQQLSLASVYGAPGVMWSSSVPGVAPIIPSTSASSPIPSSIGMAQMSPYMQLSGLQSQTGVAITQPSIPKTRGRSSSMLSDVSGFTQSSTADDDAFFMPPSTLASNYWVGTNGYGGGAATAISAPITPAETYLATTMALDNTVSSPPASQASLLRGPSVFGLNRARIGSRSGSGSGSSVHSGSASAGSGRDPASPV